MRKNWNGATNLSKVSPNQNNKKDFLTSKYQPTIPLNEPQWEVIYDPWTMEELVLQQHWKHFSQAQGTIFT